jgi:polyhydroxybutyrate depolymerase
LVRSIFTLAAALVVSFITLLASGLAIIDGPTIWRQATGHVTIESLPEGGMSRHFRVFRPASALKHPGLVIVLHGADGSGLQIERQSGFDGQADRLGWIAVYPDGYADGWNPFGCCHHPGVDDVAFVADIIDHLVTTDAVDPYRVYVTGISRGGMMSYRLACELSSRLAAIAPVAGNMADATGNASNVDCRPDRPVSVLAIHGSDDPEIPIGGGRSRVVVEEVSYAPLADVITRWRQLDACASFSAVAVEGPVTRTTWGCDQHAEITEFVISGAGHTWPGAPIVNPPWGPAATFDASRAIADFFAAHPRPGAQS